MKLKVAQIIESKSKNNEFKKFLHHFADLLRQ